MALNSKTIGTDARNYSSITTWEAALNGASGGAGNDAVGECYNDSDFSESFTINDATPDTITLTAADGEEHDGTAGTGVRLLLVTDYAGFWMSLASTKPTSVIGFDIDVNGHDPGVSVFYLDSTGGYTVRRCLVHEADTAGSDLFVFYLTSGSYSLNLLNTIVYDIDVASAATKDLIGVYILSTGSGTINICGNTLYKLTNGVGGDDCWGLYTNRAGGTHDIANNIILEVGGANSDQKVCYVCLAGSQRYNMSSDASATGTGSLINKTAADQFVSTTGGSEDLHLKVGADAIGAGVDLGTTPTGVNIDIDGYDRDAAAVTWDMGADQYVAAATGNPWYAYAQQQAILAG